MTRPIWLLRKFTISTAIGEVFTQGRDWGQFQPPASSLLLLARVELAVLEPNLDVRTTLYDDSLPVLSRDEALSGRNAWAIDASGAQVPNPLGEQFEVFQFQPQFPLPLCNSFAVGVAAGTTMGMPLPEVTAYVRLLVRPTC